MPKIHSAKSHGHCPIIQASYWRSGQRGLPTPTGTVPSYIPDRDSVLHGDRTLPDTKVKELKNNNIHFLLIMKQKTNTCSLRTLVKEKSKSLLLIPNSDNHWLAKNCYFLSRPASLTGHTVCAALSTSFPPTFFLGHATRHAGSQSPDQGLNPRSLRWKLS